MHPLSNLMWQLLTNFVEVLDFTCLACGTLGSTKTVFGLFILHNTYSGCISPSPLALFCILEL